MATAQDDDLITEVTRLPVQPGAAMRLLWMLEDPRTSAADLGRLIESDPALSTQVICLANAPFYGQSGRVSSAWRAVTVLGLATVRAIATTAALDLFCARGRPVPDDFWPHSVTAGAAAAVLGRRLGLPPNDAFSAGLLHDLGSALVLRRTPGRDGAQLGATHAEVGAAALRVMRFPAEMVRAIGSHHTPPARVPTLLGRVLVAADALAIELDGVTSETNVPIGEALEALDIPPAAEPSLLEEVASDRRSLASSLTVRG